ncbi:unnamed protein product [Gongylonema pulchrum]|uniref:Uncharacterized protein n=1 Tax=Gongylonema pulchrum TaxID=637853 RepID=A0A183EC33_9BILA|nr:unnamed protein product [Gongylonema pulchrum]
MRCYLPTFDRKLAKLFAWYTENYLVDHYPMRCYLPTFDRKLAKLFAWYTENYLVDHYPVFIALPLLLTGFLGIGFIWIKELTLLNARKLYTPVSAPAWKEERIMRELWPVRINEFLPERTFEWNRYLYVVVHGRQDTNGSFPNILEGDYLNATEYLENSIAQNKRGIGITYPRANTDGSPVYLAYNVGGVQVYANDTIKVTFLSFVYFICLRTAFSIYNLGLIKQTKKGKTQKKNKCKRENG